MEQIACHRRLQKNFSFVLKFESSSICRFWFWWNFRSLLQFFCTLCAFIRCCRRRWKRLAPLWSLHCRSCLRFWWAGEQTNCFPNWYQSTITSGNRKHIWTGVSRPYFSDLPLNERNLVENKVKISPSSSVTATRAKYHKIHRPNRCGVWTLGFSPSVAHGFSAVTREY